MLALRDLETRWLISAVVLVSSNLAIAISLLPEASFIFADLISIFAWLLLGVGLTGILHVAKMLYKKVDAPIHVLVNNILEDKQRSFLFIVGLFLSGMAIQVFIYIKNVLNLYVPFRSDILFSNADRLLFSGEDAYPYLSWMNTELSNVFYHEFWIIGIILTMAFVLLSPPSRKKTAISFSYFALWGFAAPILHWLGPAAGPLFYERLGLGDRYASLTTTLQSDAIADYLWNSFSKRDFAAGSGISAMPSMHVAMATWFSIAITEIRPNLRIFAYLCALLIFLLSISLGWHYAVDGIVGAIATTVIYFLSLQFFRDRSDHGLGNAGPG